MRGRVGVFLVLVSLAAATLARADAWVERPYNPAVGSRWIIQSETRTEDQKQGAPELTVVKIRSELTVDEKIPSGFRVSYVVHDIGVEGSTREAELMRSAVGALTGVVVHANTDAAGKPVEVENYDEVRNMMQAIIDRMVTKVSSQPQVAALLRQMMTTMLMVDRSRAAEVYLEELPMLAVGQNTGLKTGEVRQSTQATPNPLGGAPINATQQTRIAMIDAASGKIQIVRTSTLDNEAIRQFALDMMKQLSGAMKGVSPAQVEEMINKISMSNDRRVEYEVEDGMSRLVRDRSVLAISALGLTFTKTETKTVTVTPAP